MATKKTDGASDIRYDAFVKQVRPDPNQTDPISILHGYVGEGATADTIRLYADETLSEYVDVAKSDILYSITDEEDALGGSKVWVKQKADVKYNDGGTYAEGNMYDDYMGSMYDGNYGTMGTGAATQFCTIQPTLLTRNIICRPTRFICPTPQSRLIICGQPRTIFNCPTIITRGACPQPSLVDGCPSALGCTINPTVVINPGVVRPNEFSGGDVYDDYMQNMYEGDSMGGGYEAHTIATTVRTIVQTSPVVCQIIQTFQPNCFITNRANCITIRSPYCPITCGFRTRIDIVTRRCPIRTIACATDFTIPNPTVFNPGGIGRFDDDTATGFGGDAYGGGDMYNSYMQNDYTGENYGAGVNPDTAAAAIPPPTSPILCLQIPTRFPQVCGIVTQVWNTRCCFTQLPQCPPTRPFATRCCRTFPFDTRCRVTRPFVCYTPLNTLNQCQVYQPRP